MSKGKREREKREREREVKRSSFERPERQKRESPGQPKKIKLSVATQPKKPQNSSFPLEKGFNRYVVHHARALHPNLATDHDEKTNREHFFLVRSRVSLKSKKLFHYV